MDEILYFDFLQFEEGCVVKVEVFICFKGIFFGVKGGGKLIQCLCCFKIKIKLEYLVIEMWVDIFKLEFNQFICVCDVDQKLEMIEILNFFGVLIVSVEILCVFCFVVFVVVKVGVVVFVEEEVEEVIEE